MLNLTITATSMFNSRKQNKLPPISEPLLLQPAQKLSKQIKDGSVSNQIKFQKIKNLYFKIFLTILF